MQILVADDEPGIRSLIHDALVQHGYEVFCVENGTAAVDFVNGNPVDVVFMDIRMPKGDGLWALREIRKVNDRLPVIMITGCGKNEHMEEALSLGSLACLIKPFSIRDVLGMIAWVGDGAGGPVSESEDPSEAPEASETTETSEVERPPSGLGVR